MTAVADYTTSLQTSLQTAGYYDGAIDGVYGPSTVAAVEALQTDAELPVTGVVDQATAAALTAAVLAVNGDAASEAVVHTAAVQTTLKLAGYWPGAVDGEWTPELTEALKAFQEELGVEPSGRWTRPRCTPCRPRSPRREGRRRTPPRRRTPDSTSYLRGQHDHRA